MRDANPARALLPYHCTSVRMERSLFGHQTHSPELICSFCCCLGFLPCHRSLERASKDSKIEKNIKHTKSTPLNEISQITMTMCLKSFWALVSAWVARWMGDRPEKSVMILLLCSCVIESRTLIERILSYSC